MSLNTEYVRTSKEVTLIVFLLLQVFLQIVVKSDDSCPSETIHWGTESIPITWPIETASSKSVASDCLDSYKLLLLRECENGNWSPDAVRTETECIFHQASYEKYGNCPLNYVEFGKICYYIAGKISSQDLCLTTGGTSLSFFDLSSPEQCSLLNHLSTIKMSIDLSSVGMPAKNRYPSKQIDLSIDYSKEDAEVQWLLPGRYGSALKFSNNSALVTCVGVSGLCVDMCLSIDGAKSTIEKPFVPKIEECLNVNSVLCVTQTNSMMHSFGCSKSGYYHVTYETIHSLCYSIKVFEKPLGIDDVTTGPPVLPDACDGNGIFLIDTLEAHIIYRQLAQLNQLKEIDRCLFGVVPSLGIVTYYDWYHLLDANEVTFTNWDKTVDFNAVLNRDGSLLTAKPNGKWSWEERATCIVCVMDESPSTVELDLKFNTNNATLTLHVIGGKYLWKDGSHPSGFMCFARINNEYKSNLQVWYEKNDFYSVTDVGAGYYWCLGHVIRSFDFIRTLDVYAFGIIFAIYAERRCSSKCIEQTDHTEKLRELLKSLIDEDLMKIENVNYIDHDPGYTDTNIKIIFHVTVSIEQALLDKIERGKMGLSEEQLNTLYVSVELQESVVGKTNPEFDILSAKSRDFCFPDSITLPDINEYPNQETLNWKVAAAGETVVLTDHCLSLTRSCSRSGSSGAIWNDFLITFWCNDQCQSEATKVLLDLRNSFQSPEQMPEVLSNLTAALLNVTLITDDVFIVSQILNRISYYLSSELTTLESHELTKIFSIFNSLMSIEEEVAQAAVPLNSTNSLLASFDEILLHNVKATSIGHTIFTDGFASILTPLVAHFVFDPSVSGVSGIALFETGIRRNDNLLTYFIKYLHSNQSIADLLDEADLEVASFIPEKLLETWNEPKIILTIFLNDILFQSPGDKRRFHADGKIISLTVLNSEAVFSSPIPLYFRSQIPISHYDNYESICGYWNFTSDTDGWASSGCHLKEISSNLSIPLMLCECSHLTHFGNLISSDFVYNDFNERVLNLITLAGCSLSLIGILGIFITAIVFHSWRRKAGSKFLLQLSAAIALQMILLILMYADENIVSTIAGNIYGCIAIGALIHYSVLVIFFWMLIVAYLQFIRYVIVFSQLTTANFLIKSSIFGWGMPLLPVFLVITIDAKSYIPPPTAKLCYPTGYALLFGVLVPIGIIVITNIFIFAAVVVSLIKGSSKSAACKVKADKNETIWSQLRLSVFLFFLLGMAWIFGFLSMNGSILFSYLFCVTATMQGFVLFLYFVVLDPVARNLWKKFFERIFKQNTY